MKSNTLIIVFSIILFTGILFNTIYAFHGLITKNDESKHEVVPDIEIDKTVYDFGEILQDEKIDIIFTIKNSGLGYLVIGEVESSCGCTVTELVREIIPPGEEENLNVTYDSYGASGRISKSIEIISNDPDERQLILTITGTVKQVMYIEPRYLYFDDVVQGVSASNRLKIYPAEPMENFKILNIESTSKHISTKYTQSKDFGVYNVEVIISDKTPAGRFNETLTVHTNIQNKPDYQIKVRGNVESAIYVSPAYLIFRLVSGESDRKHFAITNKSKEKLKIKAVTSRLNFISTKIDSSEKDKFRVMVYVEAPEDTFGRLQEHLEIYTDDPHESVKKVLVQININPEIKVSPQKLKLNLPEKGSKREYYLIMVKSYKDAVQIEKTETDLKSFTVDEIISMEQGKLHHIRVRPKPEIKPGPIEGKVIISTNNSRYPVIEVPVSGKIDSTYGMGK